MTALACLNSITTPLRISHIFTKLSLPPVAIRFSLDRFHAIPQIYPWCKGNVTDFYLFLISYKFKYPELLPVAITFWLKTEQAIRDFYGLLK